jgi:hypothetical protein
MVQTPLVPDPASPAGLKLGPLNHLSFEEQVAFGEGRLRPVLPQLLELVAARYVTVDFGPGANEGEVEPTMSLKVQGSKGAAERLGAVIGEVGGLAWIGTYRNMSLPAGRLGLDFVQLSDPRMSPNDGARLADRLRRRCPNVRTEASLRSTGGRPCISLTDADDMWMGTDIAAFLDEADMAANELGIQLACDRLVAAVPD